MCSAFLLIRGRIKPLRKLRSKPQVSEVFNARLIRIHAHRHDIGERAGQVELMAPVPFMPASARRVGKWLAHLAEAQHLNLLQENQ